MTPVQSAVIVNNINLKALDSGKNRITLALSPFWLVIGRGRQETDKIRTWETQVELHLLPTIGWLPTCPGRHLPLDVWILISNSGRTLMAGNRHDSPGRGRWHSHCPSCDAHWLTEVITDQYSPSLLLSQLTLLRGPQLSVHWLSQLTLTIISW